MKSNRIIGRVLLSSLLLLQTAQLAAIAGPALLQRVDRVMRSRNSLMVAQMSVTTTLGSRRSFTQWGITRGSRSVTKFVSGSVKGMTVLSVNHGSQIWVYFKSSGRTRKLISNAREKSVAGSDFSYSDMANSKYSREYRVVGGVRDNGEHWQVTVKPRKPAATAYSRLDLTVRKSDSVPSRIAYYNSDGIKFKVLTVSDIKKISGVVTPMKFEMRNLLENTRSTVTVKRVKYLSSIYPRFVRQNSLDSSSSVWSSFYPFFNR